MAKLDELFKRMVTERASDLHLTTGAVPTFRLDGDILPLDDLGILTAEESQNLVFEILTDRNRKIFVDTWELDTVYEVPEVGRFRCNVFMQRKGLGAVFRHIPTEILSAEQLGLPKSLIDLISVPKGLVLVTGPTGSGKSTTLAALIDYLNVNEKLHILTVEDPIEFTHENKRSLVNQREVGGHTKSFASALKASLREDPDIILVGEMRDLETISLALTAAETGHLVFGTLHTMSAPKTVDRIIDVFPEDRQAQIRVMLSESLRGVVSQTLFPKASGKGRVAALEILYNNRAIANLIREGKTFQIPSIMQTGKGDGMVTFADSVETLIKEGKITKEVGHSFLGKVSGVENKEDTASPAQGAKPTSGPGAHPGAMPGGLQNMVKNPFKKTS
jgi:twitching motility protein PilT